MKRLNRQMLENDREGWNFDRETWSPWLDCIYLYEDGSVSSEDDGEAIAQMDEFGGCSFITFSDEIEGFFDEKITYIVDGYYGVQVGYSEEDFDLDVPSRGDWIEENLDSLDEEDRETVTELLKKGDIDGAFDIVGDICNENLPDSYHVYYINTDYRTDDRYWIED